MAADKKETITVNQTIWLIVALTPVGITTLPREINFYAQQSGWITILMASVLVLLFSYFMFLLAAHYPGQSILVISKNILGKWLGRCISLIFILLLVISISLNIRLLAEGVDTYLLFHTPGPVIILTMLLSVLYVINNGIGTVARFNEAALPFLLLIMLFIISLTIPHTEFSNFLPLLSDDLSPGGAMITSLQPFTFIFAIPFLFPFSAQPKQLWRGMIAGITIIFVIVLLFFVTVIAIFGTVEPNYIEYPSIDMARIIKFTLFERMEILFMVFWITFSYCLTMLTAYLSTFAIKQYFAKGSFFIWSLIMMSIIFILSVIPDDIDYVRRYTSLLNYISLAILFVVFPLFVFIDMIKKKVNH